LLGTLQTPGYDEDEEPKIVGTLGVRDTIITNYMPVSASTTLTLCEYTVKWVNEQSTVESKRELSAALSSLKKKYPAMQDYVYDGNTALYTRNQMDNISDQVGPYNITITFNKEILLSGIKADTLVFLVGHFFRHAKRQTGEKLITIQRNQYSVEKNQRIRVDDKIELLRGFKGIPVITRSGLLYNCDIIHKTLRLDTVFDYYTQARSKDKFEQFVSNQIVFLEYSGRTAFICGVDFDKTPETTFHASSINKDISFADYIRSAYPELKNKQFKQQPMLICKRHLREG
jgi:hypothetical protein